MYTFLFKVKISNMSNVKVKSFMGRDYEVFDREIVSSEAKDFFVIDLATKLRKGIEEPINVYIASIDQKLHMYYHANKGTCELFELWKGKEEGKESKKVIPIELHFMVFSPLSTTHRFN